MVKALLKLQLIYRKLVQIDNTRSFPFTIPKPLSMERCSLGTEKCCLRFDEFVDELRAAAAPERTEHLAVQQSFSTALASFAGLGGRGMPELAEALVHGGATPPRGLHANLWCCQPPKCAAPPMERSAQRRVVDYQ